MKATVLWSRWQAILLSVAFGFTRRGAQRFVQWITGLALNVEEHTITQSLVALGRVQDWKALESFAEYGSWDLDFLQAGITRRLDRLPNRTWHGYSVWAGDDTKVHRNSKGVWGLATGGGGCSCEVGARSAPTLNVLILLLISICFYISILRYRR